MFVFGNLIETVAFVLDKLLWLYMWVIIIRALISWVNPDPWNPIVQFLHRATEPVLSRIRRWLPMRGMALDISPIIAIFAIWAVQFFLVRTLYEIAREIR